MRRQQEHERVRALGSRLREVRRIRAITQEALAERAGMKAETISRIEGGVVYPDLVTLAKLIEALECAFGDVLDAGTGVPPTLDEERRLVARWRAAPPDARAAIDTLLGLIPPCT